MLKAIYRFVMGTIFTFWSSNKNTLYSPGEGFYVSTTAGYLGHGTVSGSVSHVKAIPGEKCARVYWQDCNLLGEEDAKYVTRKVYPDPLANISIDEMIKAICKQYNLNKRVRIKLDDTHLFIGDEIFTKKDISSIEEEDGERISVEHASGGFHLPFIQIGKNCEYDITFIDLNGKIFADVTHGEAWKIIDEWFNDSSKVSN